MDSALFSVFAQMENQVQVQPPPDLGPAPAIILAVQLVLVVLMIAGLWKVFTKAGEPGWAAIVPIYNAMVLLKLAGRPMWWVVLFLIPCVGFVFAIIAYIDLAKAFGKGVGYGLGMVFLPFIFFPLLGFGDAVYRPIPRPL